MEPSKMGSIGLTSFAPSKANHRGAAKPRPLCWTMLLAASIYVYGCPTFDGYRPGDLGRAVEAFHGAVDKADRECKPMLETAIGSLRHDLSGSRWAKVTWLNP